MQQKNQDSRQKRSFLLCTFFSLLGLGLSLYAMRHQKLVDLFEKTQAYCNINKTFNCDVLAKSSFSHFLSVPLAVWGGAFFSTLLILSLIFLRAKTKPSALLTLFSLLSFSSAFISIILALISWLAIDTFCLNCLLIYLVCFLLAWQGKKILPAQGSQQKMGSTRKALFQVTLLLVASFSLNFLIMKSELLLSSGAKTTVLQQKNRGAEQLSLAKKVFDIPYESNIYASLGPDYAYGPKQAKVIIHKFSDFQCPACKTMAQLLKQIVSEYQGRVKVVYRNYPLDMSCNESLSSPIHPAACQASLLARCAGRVGKFWDFHDLLFKRQEKISKENLNKWMKELNISEEKRKKCQKDPVLLKKLKSDIALATSLGVRGTPSLFIQGKKYNGRGLQDLRLAVETALARHN